MAQRLSNGKGVDEVTKDIKRISSATAALLALTIVLTIYYSYKRPTVSIEQETVKQYYVISQSTTAEPFNPYPVPLDINIQWYINAQCEVKDIPTELAIALIWKESRYQADAISNTNDYGLMQVNACNKAEVERVLNVTNLLDPYQNCKAGLYILDRCIEQTDTLDKALMVYNLGESGAKAQWKQGIDSTDFSRSVLAKMAELEGAL